MKKIGDTIKIKDKEYTLEKQLGGGGEGTVFEITVQTKNGPNKAAVKIINTKRKTPFEIAAIRRQINDLIDTRKSSKEKNKESGVSLSSFMTLPQCALDNDTGYLMGVVKDSEPLTNYLTIPETAEEQEEWQIKHDLRKRYKIIAYLFERLEKIHIEGLIFSDLSPNNILVSLNNDCSLKFIDTDNLRTKSNPFTNVLGTPGFIAPELYKDFKRPDVLTTEEAKNIADNHLLSEESDVYSAAVIAFELLTLNHPFKGIKATGENTTPEDELAAERGEMDYILKPGTENYCDNNIFVNKFNDITTPEIRDLFARTFIEGKDNPLQRPTASEFKDEFQRVSRLIVKCPYCGEERIYSTYLDNDKKLVSNTTCINPECKKDINGQLLFTIYASGIDKSPEEVILGPKAVNHQNAPIFFSKAILKEGEVHIIYSSDVGMPGDLKREDRFATLLLKNGIAEISLIRKQEDFIAEILSFKGKPPIPFTTTAKFPYENDEILFRNIKTKYGTMTLKGKIQKV